MSRRPSAIGIVAVLSGLLLTMVVLAAVMADRLITFALGRWLGAPVSLARVDIRPAGMTLAGLTVGAELEAERLTLGWGWAGLTAVEAHGLRLVASLDDGLSLGPLDRLRGGGGAGGGMLPALRITDALVTLRHRGASVALPFTAEGGGDRLALMVDLAAAVEQVVGQPTAAVALLTIEARLGATAGSTATVQLDTLPASLHADIAWSEGTLRLSSADGLRLRLGLAPGLMATLPPWLRSHLGGKAEATIGGRAGRPLTLSVTPGVDFLRVAADLAVTLSGAGPARAVVQLAGGIDLLTDGLPRRLDIDLLRLDLARFRLPVGVADGSVGLSGLRGAPPLSTTETAIDLVLHDAAAAGWSARRLALAGNGRLTLDGFRLVHAFSDGRLAIDGLHGEGLALAEPVTLPIRPGSSVEAVLGQGRELMSLHPDLRFGPATAQVVMSLAGMRLPAELAAEDIALGGMVGLPGGEMAPRLAIVGGRMTLRDDPLRADGVAFTYDGSIPAALPRLDLTIDRIGGGGKGTALALRAAAEPRDGALAYRAHLTGAAGRIDLTATGRWRPAANAGSARLRLKPLAFAPGVLQPADLMPGLAEIAEDVEGTVALAGTVAWQGARVRSDLELLLENLAATLGGVAVAGINGVIALDGLAPLSSAGEQTVAVGRIEAGLPFTDGEFAFRLDNSRLLLREGRMALAGGQVWLGDTALDPAARRQHLLLHVAAVDLAGLVALTGLDGLAATGKLSGTVPVTLEDGTLRFKDGVLRTDQPGVLRYRPQQPPAALAGGGQPVQLMLKALDDFRYSALTMTLNGAVGGDLIAAVTLAGSNPDLYGGYPLEFNLTISGKLDRILHEAVTSYNIPDRIRERMMLFGDPGSAR